MGESMDIGKYYFSVLNSFSYDAYLLFHSESLIIDSFNFELTNTKDDRFIWV